MIRWTTWLSTLHAKSVATGFAVVVFAIAPAGGATLLSDDFSDGEFNGAGNTGPEWTFNTDSFLVTSSTYSDDEIRSTAAAGARMTAAITPSTDDTVVVELELRSTEASTGGGRSGFVYLVDPTGSGFGFNALISQRDPVNRLRLGATADGGATFARIGNFANEPGYGGADQTYQHYRIEWNRSSGVFSTWIDGVSTGTLTASAADRAALSDFTQVVVATDNAVVRIDEVRVTTIPEPSTLLLASVGAALMLRRRGAALQ